MRLTKNLLIHSRPADVLFLVNPLDNGSQADVTIETFIVESLEKGGLLLGQSSSHFEPTQYVASRHFIADTVGCHNKGAFTTLKEAQEYLELVHAGTFAKQVKAHHDSVTEMFNVYNY